jgi:hypothetical protein
MVAQMRAAVPQSVEEWMRQFFQLILIQGICQVMIESRGGLVLPGVRNGPVYGISAAGVSLPGERHQPVKIPVPRY